MATGPGIEDVGGPIARLFGEGSASGMDEGELLRRFAVGRDPVALEVLVARHGPMVLGVCRRVLGNRHSSEDAFQATFLVLAKRAGSIRDPDRLGPWLHGVAHRVAVRARADLARRNARERPGAEELAMETSADDSGFDRLELRAALDEEVRRLPEKFREPIVLCYLDGLTHDEAASRLRCPVGTVRSRLSTGRAKLRERLTRRGVAVPSGVFAAVLTAEGASAAVSPVLLSSTVKAATAFAGGMAAATAAGMVSAGVASLAEGVSKTMILSKLKIVGGLALAGMLTLGVGAVAAYQVGSKGQDAKAEKPAKEKAKMAEKGPKLDETVKAAEAYLDLLDEGKYAESWDAMSAVAHEAIARAGWAENVGKVRAATGKLKGRKLKRLDLRATGAADRFNQAWFYAEFRAVGGETWSELVILTLEKGKDWKIDTYMIGDPTKIPKPPAE
jgi:RNA polymerase sigma factor (sigma-70 family)